MFYTHTITEERLQEIKDVYSDKGAVNHPNGGVILSDGRRAFGAVGQELDILFNMALPKKASKRNLVFQCRKLFRLSAGAKRYIALYPVAKEEGLTQQEKDSYADFLCLLIDDCTQRIKLQKDVTPITELKLKAYIETLNSLAEE